MSKNGSKGGSGFWKNLSLKNARGRGEAGTEKRWGDKNKDK